ncbi:hypothetical protein PBV87_15170 [Niameybacter massiliensis]|uniref:Uncharacterized protein n=1 Tax=Holtiella tumoricola TaxID=3018743 RepID=A0AA42DQA5_9FIRM|nr:hypothetical protein [Holtiella tumoricola]MDA3732816.1 hypothetical protein [Holtiella tumoricola]
MSISGVFFTNKGRILQAKAQTGTPLHFTRIAIGDGELQGQAPQTLNVLISEKLSIDITKLVTGEDGTAKIGGSFNNSNLETGFYYRELGLFARDPDDSAKEILYVYGNAGALADYIPAQGSELIEKKIDIIAIIGNAINVSATINQSLVYATIEDIEDHNINPVAHPELINQIKNLSSPYVIPEGSDIPIQDRVKGKMYFKVTSRQNGGSSNGIIKVSPNMGIEIKE